MTALAGHLTLDLETSIHKHLKRTASPWHPENYVVMAGWAVGSGEPQSRYYRSREAARGDGLLAELLTAHSPAFLFGVNIKFDLLQLLVDQPKNYAAYQEWVAEGGMVWDAQLAEYLLEGMTQANHMLSMDEIAPRYGGGTKVDAVKELWAAGVNTPDIDPDLLRHYLCGAGDDLGDIGNTRLICTEQIKRARAAKQVNSILLNMGSLISSTEMELNGMHVDTELGLKLAAELGAEVQTVTLELTEYLPKNLPFEFKWTSRFHKSALIFGGTVQYEDREYVHADGSGTLCSWWNDGADGEPRKPLTYPMLDEDQYLLTDGTTWPKKDDSTLSQLWGLGKEVMTFKSGKNAGEYKTRKVKVLDLSRPKTRKCRAPYTFPGYTAPKKEWESAEPGVYSTASEVIEELGVRDIPFLKALARLQAMTKDLGTYYLTEDPKTGDRKGMLTLVGADGIVHHGLNHCSTVTGRFSSNSPNLQNLPKGNKSDVKTVFTSRFPGGTIIQSDFSALEVYVQAVLTGSANLTQALRDGKDMHCMRLAFKEGMPYEEVYALCKGDKFDKAWDYKRTAAKIISFQQAYGAGAPKIAASTGLPVAEIEAFLAAEDEANPEIKVYFDALTQDIKKSRKPTGTAVPHPFVPGVMCNLGRGFSRTPDGCLYGYVESPSPEYLCRKGVTASFSPTQVKNYVVQGTGATVMKAAMMVLVRAFFETGNLGGKAVIVNTIHDAAYVDCHPDVVDEAYCLLHESMAQSTELLRRMFKWDWSLDVPSDTSLGGSMAEEKAFSPDPIVHQRVKAQVLSIVKRITRTN